MTYSIIVLVICTYIFFWSDLFYWISNWLQVHHWSNEYDTRSYNFGSWHWVILSVLIYITANHACIHTYIHISSMKAWVDIFFSIFLYSLVIYFIWVWRMHILTQLISYYYTYNNIWKNSITFLFLFFMYIFLYIIWWLVVRMYILFFTRNIIIPCSSTKLSWIWKQYNILISCSTAVIGPGVDVDQPLVNGTESAWIVCMTGLMYAFAQLQYSLWYC